MAQTDWQKALCKGISTKAFRRKYGAKKKTKKQAKKHYKTKGQRREWWYNLTPAQQAEQIEKWQAQKALKREAKSRRIMSKAEMIFECKECLHRKTRHCIDNLPNGCEYWFSPNSKNEPPRALKFDPKYPWATEGVNSKNKKQWLAMIHKKNPWLKLTG